MSIYQVGGEEQYLELLQAILDHGIQENNERTGVGTIKLSGATMRFDLAKGAPIPTTKKFAFKSCMAELCGHLEGVDSVQEFQDLGTKVWDSNESSPLWRDNVFRDGSTEGHLGPIYGVQWRRWPAFKKIAFDDLTAAKVDKLVKEGWTQIALSDQPRAAIWYKAIDQVKTAINAIMNNPGNRRILYHAWNPAQLEEMCLPPCHLLYQFIVDQVNRRLHCVLYQRSGDAFLGVPFNTAMAAAKTHLFAAATGYKPGILTHQFGDVHIYANHVDQVKEQITRTPYTPPQLELDHSLLSLLASRHRDVNDIMDIFSNLQTGDFRLVGYQHHPAIKAPMAV